MRIRAISAVPSICTQHNDQSRCEGYQILSEKRGHQHGGGITALYQCGNADPRAKGERLFFDAPAKDSTQTRAEDAHYAGSNNMSPQTSRATAESR